MSSTGEECLADKFPTLLSHCKRSTHKVREILDLGLGPNLVPCMAPCQELDAVCWIKEAVSLSVDEDTQLCSFAVPGGKLHMGPLYKLLPAAQGTDSSISKFV